MDLDDGPPPGDPGDLGHFGHFDSNQLATQANYPHDNAGNMDCEETGLETVDFGTYAATLTASTIDDADADADGNNTLEIMLRNRALPKDQIQAILATTGKQNGKMPRNGMPRNGKNDGKNEMHDDDDEDQELNLAKITPLKKSAPLNKMNPKGKNLDKQQLHYHKTQNTIHESRRYQKYRKRRRYFK